MKSASLLAGQRAVLEVACTMRRTVAMLDGSADMLERMADLASATVAVDLRRHAGAVRAIRLQVAGPPHRSRASGEADADSQFEAGSAD
jgi:hypothetical protein